MHAYRPTLPYPRTWRVIFSVLLLHLIWRKGDTSTL